MWICPDCNTALTSPVDNKCINGHPLWNRHIWGPTRSQGFPRAFITALAVAVLLLIAAAAARRFIPDTFGPNTVLYAAGMIAILGIDGLWTAASWARKGKPTSGLAARACGMGLGCLAAAAGGFALAQQL